MRLVLASQSPARLALLRAAGFDPEPIVSGVDEDAFDAPNAAQLALTLAQAKARAVAERVGSDALVVGCDSLLDFEGEALGKPSDAGQAVERWKRMRGREGILVTGHCVIDTRGEERVEVCDAAATLVQFAEVTDAQIEAYVATGEPLQVAGCFTIDGIGASFVESISGDHSNVIGLSLPLLRRMLDSIGVEVTQLWRADLGHAGLAKV
jgi:septum formation protein